MNMNRIGALIRYDWMLHKHNIKLTYAVIAIIYICIALLYFLSKASLHLDIMTDKGSSFYESLPTYISGFCVTFFNYAGYAVVFLMTSLVTEKYCHPRTATAYLTLPGTTLEKFCVVAIDFIAAFVALKVLYLIMFYLTMGICYLNAPDLDWSINGLALLLPEETMNMANNIVTQIQGVDKMEELKKLGEMNNETMNAFIAAIENTQKAGFWMAPFSTIASVVFYLILNMFFKTNVQIKAIGCIVISYIAYIVITMIVVFGILGKLLFESHNLSGNDADLFVINNIFEPITGFLNFMAGLIYAMPLIAAALLWVFYYQIKRKQAK